MDIIILAGGKGTRLKKIIGDIPKVMVEVNKKPFLFHTLEYLSKYPINNVILSVYYNHEYIRKVVGDSYKNMKIIYSVDDNELGTGGAIKHALEYTKENDIIAINGDIIADVDLNKLYSTHKEGKNYTTLTTKLLKNYDRFGTVIIEDNKVIEFKEKGYQKEGNINVGFYVINKEYFENNSKNIFSIEKDFFEKEALKKKIGIYQYNGKFLDIGTPEDYKKASEYLN